jgi:hypothetical protein
MRPIDVLSLVDGIAERRTVLSITFLLGGSGHASSCLTGTFSL